MKTTLGDRIVSTLECLVELFKATIMIPVAIICLIWELIKLIFVHPVRMCWLFFKGDFIVSYYFGCKYDNVDKPLLDWINKDINRFCKNPKTIRGYIHRWTKLKILERNNYEYDENLTWENQGNYSKNLKTE